MLPWHLVFDLDDTLYLERDYVRSGFQAVAGWGAREHGIEGLFGVCWKAFEAGVRNSIFDLALTELRGSAGGGLVAGLVAEMVGVYRGHVPSIALAPDAAALLPRLQRSVSLSLITDGPVICQRNKIASLRLAERFETIVVTDEMGVAYRKPHPRAFEIVVQARTPAQPARFAYIGDNPKKDFIAPQQMGWTTVRIRRPEGLHSLVEMPGESADFEIQSLADLPSILTGLLSVASGKLSHEESCQAV